MTPWRRIGKALLIASITTIALAPSAKAAPGDLDPSFAGDGVAVGTFRDSYGVANSLAIQPDGRIVAAGSMHRNSTIQADLALVRYMPTGSLDRTFAGNGKLRTDFGGRFEDALTVAVQPDGKILAAGSATGVRGDGIAIARYRGDGTLDRHFSRNGRRVVHVGVSNIAYDLGLQSDDDIVLAGTDGEDFVLLRLNGNGTSDRSFGQRGIVRTDFNGFADVARALAIADDGSIVAGGWAQSEATRIDFALARYDEHGVLDESFGEDGRVTTDFLTYDDAITDLVLDPTGDIVVSGSAGEDPGDADQSTDVALARYKANGALDASFGEGGTVRADFGSFFDQAEGMALQPDGRIVVASHLYADGSNSAGVARYEMSGELDPSFGDGGFAYSGARVSGDAVGGVALQPDGRIVVATAASTGDPQASFGFLLVRFLAA